MRATWNKFVRDTLETKVLSKYKKLSPNVDQYINRLRFPSIPRIVIYTNVNGAQKYLQQIFPLYKYITPTPSTQNDQILARTVAEQLITPLGTQFGGYLVKGFPFNVNQAILLDRYLNGVNLAIHLRGKQELNLDQPINNLLNYYDQRGTLIRLQHQQNPTAQNIQWTIREVVSNIKLSQ